MAGPGSAASAEGRALDGSAPVRATLQVDAGVAPAGGPPAQIAADVIAPARPAGGEAIVLVCLPGGGMTRQYFDLPAPGDDSFSFARQMAARGFVCVLLDHLGVGGSTRPADGYSLLPERLVQAAGAATGVILGKLREGSAVPGLPALPGLRAIGVGHSMGAMMTILQQAALRQYSAVALLGFSTRGLPEYLPPGARHLDPADARAQLVDLARAMFVEDYPVIGRSADGSTLYAGERAEAAGVEAVKAVRTHLLPVTAFMSMLPGNVAPEAARLDVPVFLGLGERDLAGPPHQVPAAFTASRDVTLHLLPGAGHSHFLFPARRGLFDRLADWARSVVTNC